MKYPAIKENYLYKKVYAKGKKHAGRLCVYYALPDIKAGAAQKNKPVNRIGITVTKRQGGAVTRNRIKRIIREAYRQLDCGRGVTGGHLIVIVARDAAATASSRDIGEDMERGFERLSLLCHVADTAACPDNGKE